MWFPIVTNNNNFIIDCLYDDEYFTIYCSDFKHIWKENLTISNELDSRFKELNRVEMSAEKLKAKIYSMFYGDRKSSNFNVTQQSNELILEVETQFPNIKLNMKFILKEETVENLSKKLIIPMCFSLIKTKNREKQLLDIIKRKDIELKEHQLSGQFIENRNLCTPTFNEDNFKQGASDSFSEIFSSDIFIKKFQENYVEENSDDSFSVDNEPNNSIDNLTSDTTNSLLQSKIKRKKQIQGIGRRFKRNK